MNLKNARVLIASQFAAPYEGNFISSLKVLQRVMKERYNTECAYAFPRAMASQPWADDFMKANEVFLTGSQNVLISPYEADDIMRKFKPTLVYTHFEGYDTAMLKAIRRSGVSAKLVWHMHDTLSYQRNILKAAYQSVMFFKHYGLPFLLMKRGGVKPCMSAVCQHELRFVGKFRLGLQAQQIVIPNGIVLSRIHSGCRQQHPVYTFLAFAGRNVQKRVDLLIKAAERLVKEGFRLKIIMVDGSEQSVADTIFLERPDWLTVIRPKEDVNSVFAMADCFVSTSVRETFSYAVAEASIFGLPVIQSDIEGTRWNAGNPSTFVFPSGNVDALADTMLKVMKMPEDELSKLCAETAAYNSREFSMEGWTDKMIKFFESI